MTVQHDLAVQYECKLGVSILIGSCQMQNVTYQKGSYKWIHALCVLYFIWKNLIIYQRIYVYANMHSFNAKLFQPMCVRESFKT